MTRMGHEFPGQLQKGAEAESLALRGDGIWEEQSTRARNLENLGVRTWRGGRHSRQWGKELTER